MYVNWLSDRLYDATINWLKIELPKLDKEVRTVILTDNQEAMSRIKEELREGGLFFAVTCDRPRWQDLGG